MFVLQTQTWEGRGIIFLPQPDFDQNVLLATPSLHPGWGTIGLRGRGVVRAPFPDRPLPSGLPRK